MQRRDIAYDEAAGKPKDMIVIADIDTGRRATDAAPPRCVSAKSLIQKATDATDATDARIGVDSPRPLQEEAGDAVAERASDAPDRKTRFRPQQALPNGRLRQVQERRTIRFDPICASVQYDRVAQ